MFGPDDPTGSPASFHSQHPAGCNFLLMDGSVRVLSSAIALDLFRALATRDRGEIILGSVFD